MQVLPSKELLSEIFMYKVTQIHNIDAENNIHFNGGNEARYPYFLIKPITINIYELANKCKEWALSKNNLELISAITEDGAYCQIDNMVPSTIEYDISQMDTSYRTVFNSIIFDADTEPEAIFKATSYIMEQLKQKD